MINHIKLHGVATYSEPVDISFKEINFLYGGNGTGKTTISKVISGDIMSPTCDIDRNDSENETILVYNKPFVDRNFREVSSIAGIFTLGDDAGEAQAFIEGKEKEYTNISNREKEKEHTLSNLEKEKNEITQKFQEDCWQVQVKYGASFPQALAGTRGAKVAFANKCCEVYNTFDGNTVKTEEELHELYYAAFSKDATMYSQYPLLDMDTAAALDGHCLLTKQISGKADSDIGRFIEYLGSSDWVKRGTLLANKAHGKCPYCARPLPSEIKADIEEFFDESYQKECQELQAYCTAYQDFSSATIKQLDAILTSNYGIISYDYFSSKVAAYRALVDKNEVLLSSKLSSPSMSVAIEPCIDILIEINEIIKTFNKKIQENNALVEHQRDTQKICKQEVWLFIVAELQSVISTFNRNLSGKNQAINNVSAQRKALAEKLQEIDNCVKEKRASISNVHHTVLAINKILEGYGFTGFMLAENEAVRGTYKIVRPDGTDAKASLSEGEYNFITFLYFYHLVFGSKEPDGAAKNKVIVIDDPISSLDSNVLFIVSSLVKNIISFCRLHERSVTQVIISTHNIYFHKEITFIGNRDHWPKTKTAFFILRKKNEVTSVTEYSDNQIQSSYEMLWNDIRQPTNSSAKSIFNTMRRILENYFNIIGGIDYEKCINEFSGQDKLICKSLISCINEQSHTISDDYFMCIEDGDIEHYLLIFRQIFEKMNHISHYNMMMRIKSE
jgi:wobble nucleotide-excising tRNase